MALMWNRTVDWDADDSRRAGSMSQHRTGPVLPGRHDRSSRRPDRRRQALCRSCEALEPCLDFALATNQESGVWGGTSEEERRKLRKAWLAARRSQRTF